TTSDADRLCPRKTTSTALACRSLRMMLIEASCPSKRLVAVTNRIRCRGWYCRACMVGEVVVLRRQSDEVFTDLRRHAPRSMSGMSPFSQQIETRNEEVIDSNGKRRLENNTHE